jgi:hypothetical protein
MEKLVLCRLCWCRGSDVTSDWWSVTCACVISWCIVFLVITTGGSTCAIVFLQKELWPRTVMLHVAHIRTVWKTKLMDGWLSDRRVNPFTASCQYVLPVSRCKIPRSAHTVFMCFVWIWEQPLFPYTTLTDGILGVLAKLRKTTVSFRLSAWNSSAPAGRIFMKFYILSVFQKSVEKIKFSLKSDKNNGRFSWRSMYIFIVSRSGLLRMRNISVYVENIRTHVLCSIPVLFFKSYLYEIMWKITDYTMVHAHYMLDTKVYKYTLRICNTYCSSTATMHERDLMLRYSYFACLVTMGTACIYWAVRTDSLNIVQVGLSSIKRPCHGSGS